MPDVRQAVERASLTLVTKSLSPPSRGSGGVVAEVLLVSVVVLVLVVESHRPSPSIKTKLVPVYINVLQTSARSVVWKT